MAEKCKHCGATLYVSELAHRNVCPYYQNKAHSEPKNAVRREPKTTPITSKQVKETQKDKVSLVPGIAQKRQAQYITRGRPRITHKCSICGGLHRAKGLCKICYQREYMRSHKKEPVPF